MKHILIFLFFAVFVPLANTAQLYFPIPDSNAKWNTVERPYPPGPIPWYWAHYDYITEGDTIINNQNYSMLNRIDYDVQCSLEYTGPYYFGGIRNDISHKEVYFFPLNGTQEYLLYNFDLNIGDTVPLTFNNFSYPYLYVEDIDSTLIGDSYRRTFIYGNRRDRRPINVIEGIGAETGLLEPMSYAEQNHYIKCFYQNDTLLYLYPDDTSCFLETDTCAIVSIEEKGRYFKDMLIYPNPCKNLIFICNNSFEKFDTYAVLYDMLSREILRKSLPSYCNAINLSILEDGFYIVYIRDKLHLYSYKIFKCH